MALLGLFFTTRAKIGAMELDCSINETHDATATVTQNEVEDGSSINDNVVLMPLKLTIEGLISKTPLGVSGLIGSAGSALATQVAKSGKSKLAAGAAVVGIASVGGLVASSFGTVAGPKSRSPSDVYDYLVELRNQRQPFDVQTALKLYQNMVLTSVSAPRSIKEVGGLRFTAVMEQVTIVSASTVFVSGTSGAAAAANLGKQAASGASGSVSSNATIAYSLFVGD